MSNEIIIKSGGVSFTGLLTIVFIILKLTGFITWSWIWVLCPLWVGLVIFTVLLVVFLICFLVAILEGE